jgi:hypothetical protein
MFWCWVAVAAVADGAFQLVKAVVVVLPEAGIAHLIFSFPLELRL